MIIPKVWGMVNKIKVSRVGVDKIPNSCELSITTKNIS